MKHATVGRRLEDRLLYNLRHSLSTLLSQVKFSQNTSPDFSLICLHFLYFQTYCRFSSEYGLFNKLKFWYSIL